MTSTALTFPTDSSLQGGSFSIILQPYYGYSVGILGCEINTNRAAYLPWSMGYDRLCVKVSANGRTVKLLHADRSSSAYSISYDA
ncbi:hypothetical protein F5Y19DRAFT_451185 [Xylariaceae sp. FL1651]|nr:hypothetical protein F5Y19DRAFT_451185 [Xylariaceae sp. FL1651]